MNEHQQRLLLTYITGFRGQFTAHQVGNTAHNLVENGGFGMKSFPVLMLRELQTLLAQKEHITLGVPRKAVLPELVRDLEARIAKGTKEYGEPLTTDNTRHALQDAYEEAMDQALYIKQQLMEMGL